MQNKIQPVLIGLLVIASFAIGSMWTELRTLKNGSKLQKQVEEKKEGEVAGEETETEELSEEQWKELMSSSAGVKGSDDAKVTIVELTDYQCPFCKRYVDQSMNQIVKDYVDTGKVRYMLRDLALPFHSNAHLAAEAARCGGEQGKYWEYHDKLFASQEEWSEGKADNLFKQYAGEVGLNEWEFNSCLDEGKYKTAVDEDIAMANKLGVRGTPTFFINGKKLVGAVPWATFKAAIDEALAE